MKSLKFILGSIVLLIIVGIGILAIARRGPGQRPITLGVILPLSGTMSKAGNDVKAALEIAQEDLRETFPNVTLIYEDDQFKPDASVAAFKKLATLDVVDAIIGPLNGSSIEAIKPLAKEHELMTTTPWGAGNRIGDFFLKNSLEADKEAETIATYAVETRRLKKFGILYLKNDFGMMHAQAFKNKVDALGAELAAEENFVVGTTDFRTQILKLKDAGIEGLYIVHNGAGVGNVTKQAWELGLRVQFFGQYATESSDLVSVGGESLEGLMYTFPLNESELTQNQVNFRQRFSAKTGGLPQVASYNAYDIYTMLIQASAKCEKKDKVCVKEVLKNVQSFDGIGGKFSIVNERIERPLYFKTIRNGKFEVLNLF